MTIPRHAALSICVNANWSWIRVELNCQWLNFCKMTLCALNLWRFIWRFWQSSPIVIRTPECYRSESVTFTKRQPIISWVNAINKLTLIILDVDRSKFTDFQSVNHSNKYRDHLTSSGKFYYVFFSVSSKQTENIESAGVELILP